tara:strand:- start:2822 stop:4177 length:1356 start_codon:yes stop_codon:yes gene_type:complete
MKKQIKIGNAQAFWGDQPGAAARLVETCPDLDFLTLDYLAEVSLSIMAIQRERDPDAGYARDFLEVVRSLLPVWNAGGTVKVITNAGGLNPPGCAREIRAILDEAGLANRNVGVVTGDDVLELLRSGEPSSFKNTETAEPFDSIRDRLRTANAYIGATPVAEALRAGADIVVTGRVADPSLTVGAAIAAFDWQTDDWDRIAAATVAGHLIECGTQMTGGCSTDWMDVPGQADLGFPIIEMEADGSFVATKAESTGGRVSLQTVKEQLLYEIGDPGRYLSPDATVSFLGLDLEELGKDRIKITGARGGPPPVTYKVSATWHDGFRAEGMLVIVGNNAVAKARRAGEVLIERIERKGFVPDRTAMEVIGSGDVTGGAMGRRTDLVECVLRVAVFSTDRAVADAFAKEVAPLVTSGPQGVTGYTSGRPKVRPVFGYWPCLIDRENVKPRMEIVS